MSKTGGSKRKRTTSEAKPRGTDGHGGGPEEAAAFIAATAADLSQIARRHGLPVLGHLLDMAQLEAGDWLRNRRRLS